MYIANEYLQNRYGLKYSINDRIRNVPILLLD